MITEESLHKMFDSEIRLLRDVDKLLWRKGYPKLENILKRKLKRIVLKFNSQPTSVLEDREIAIILGRLDKKTLEELGKRFGVTRERIRQIEAKAIEKLKMKCYE
jgi:DNA-directed RNA polymerase sigma subunit (sigma70/sigma32)